MKIRLFFSVSVLLVSVLLVSCNNQTPAYKDASLPVEKRVEDLLSRMTLEEKAAQLDMLAANDILENSETLSEEHVRYYIDSMNIGAIHDLYPKTAALANQLQKHAIENSRLGIPLLFIEEALHGYQGAGATDFPIPQGNASTWDTTLIYNIGRVIATEARAHGIHFVLGPNLDLAREIRWGRVEETFGEDTYLTSRMAVNLIKGLQGTNLSDNNSVVAEPKHFALHGSPENGSNEGPVYIGEREMRSTGLYVFEKAIKEGHAMGIMAAYHEIDGVPSVANKWLLTDILRNEWGFDGMVVTDLGAINKQIGNHHTAANEEEAIVNSIAAGLDMQFYDFKYEDFQRIIVEATKHGKLAQKALDRAVADVLRIKFLLGLFDHPYTDETLADQVFHTDENKALALDAARQSIILLKNDKQLLPFNKEIKRITLTGNLANATYVGGYSPAGAKAVSVYHALQEMVGQARNDKGLPKITIDYVSREVSDRFASVLPAFLSPALNSNENGLKVEYFNNPDLSGTPTYTTMDANLNPYWHNLSPAPGINSEQFSVRWSGYITVPTTGTYEFDFRADDYGRIFVHNQLFVDHWKDDYINHSERYRIHLEAGKKIPFRAEFAKLTGNAGMWIKWRLTNTKNTSLYSDITRSAVQSDVVIVVMGECQEEVGESRDKHDLNPHAMDMELLKAAVKSGKPVITVMITGRPLILTEVAEISTALLQCWFPGEATGTAITDVLFGETNPSGKLTISFPKSQGQLPVYYSHKPSLHRRYVDGNGEPLFPFGYGLSYTTFEYKNLKITPVHPSVKDHITVELDVTNTGDRDGAEVVQLYINDKISTVTVPVKELKGFAKVFIKAGETQHVTMTLTPEHLSLINLDMKRVVEPGEFEISIGSSSEDIQLSKTFIVK
ncbi:MAG: 4-beta-xylosidase [Candidatus Ordinivivax streblomastigis]|uniref:beta-glucosidase n=1 Tax=Candidatus Ordinivivax streblomastigis TaxID=2540710 RepID=A0A5M8P3K6_9BACT|nr:MAG: 4-beta-xylosidase [Candidatus Ordinivivax streblomastigis]